MAALPNKWKTDLLVQTFEAMSDRITDNIFKGIPFLQFLLREGRVTKDGGKEIVESIRYGVTANKGFITQDSTLGVELEDITTAATYYWCDSYVNVVTADKDIALNMGTNQIHDILMTRVDSAEKDFQEMWSQNLMDHAGTAPDANGANPKPNNLGFIVNNQGNIGVGGIVPNASQNVDTQWWKSQVAPERPTNYDYATKFRKDLHRLVVKCAINKTSPPNLILMNDEMWIELQDLSWDKVQVTPATQVDFQFAVFMFGSAMVLYDAHLTAPSNKQNRIYVLNTDDLKFVTHSERWMEKHGPMRLPTKAHNYLQCFSTAQLVCKSRRTQGVWDQGT